MDTTNILLMDERKMTRASPVCCWDCLFSACLKNKEMKSVFVRMSETYLMSASWAKKKCKRITINNLRQDKEDLRIF